MNANWHDHLQARLLDIRPDSVCALDPQSRQLATDTLPGTPVHPHGELPQPACTLALGITVLNGLDAQHAQHIISQTRLYIAPRILLVAQADCALDDASFRALGFTLALTDPADKLRLYDYDLATYKTVPDWLNARFWANPERWQP